MSRSPLLLSTAISSKLKNHSREGGNKNDSNNDGNGNVDDHNDSHDKV
eukprot:CAMPEP_0204652056 /NCGR_PEP_ID=MMETSP0718-20130828/14337_1 /ASSEMBLY_ACC=CAM_ASM_000674 /TAXON_ID=230516 /ORGANISM="Chaetoceros curvisetus" /LENGTH=47 /DNA_ID= /DNA_START= /DNA_END= /DNA_ORIENTATION=